MKCPQLKNPTAVIYQVVKTAAVKVPLYGPPPDYTSHIIPRPDKGYGMYMDKKDDKRVCKDFVSCGKNQ